MGTWGEFGATDVGRIRPKVLILNGGQGRNRTTDTRIFSPQVLQPTVTQGNPRARIASDF